VNKKDPHKIFSMIRDVLHQQKKKKRFPCKIFNKVFFRSSFIQPTMFLCRQKCL